MTDRAPPRSAISNGTRMMSANSRLPMATGAMLRPAREAEYPAKCFSVAWMPADCRPRTYAVPTEPTR
jgi:hypothetical protein